MIEEKKGHIDVTIRAKDAEVNKTLTVAKIAVAQGVFTHSGGGGFTAEDLISSDDNNDLKLGSDSKLLAQSTGEDFLAYYILKKG